MRRVAVLGGGPAGAFAAERLAGAGLNTVVIDEKLAWEKPCGGGLTAKAYRTYPFLLENDTPKKMVTESVLKAGRAGAARLKLPDPIVIYSRFELNQLLLERARTAGARLEQARVVELERAGACWRIRTAKGSLDADFCIVATGARNPLRNVGTEWRAADTMHALGYYVPGDRQHIDIEFLPGLEGYIWVFPRCGHLSVGICGKRAPAPALRARLETFMRERGFDFSGSRFYAHVLPSLEASSWDRNRISGDGWLAVGDAGGLTDPFTGEGLYYALRSADLASQVILSSRHAPAEKPGAYRELVARDFGADLACASYVARRVFLGRFLFGGVTERTVQFIRRSPRFRRLIQDVMAGTQNYLGLKPRALGTLHAVLLEVFASWLLGAPVRE